MASLFLYRLVIKRYVDEVDMEMEIESISTVRRVVKYFYLP